MGAASQGIPGLGASSPVGVFMSRLVGFYVRSVMRSSGEEEKDGESEKVRKKEEEGARRWITLGVSTVPISFL